MLDSLARIFIDFAACAFVVIAAWWLAKNGWGKALAIYHARAAKFEAQFAAHVATALPASLAPLVQRIEQVEAKVGIVPAPSASPPAPPPAA